MDRTEGCLRDRQTRVGSEDITRVEAMDQSTSEKTNEDMNSVKDIMNSFNSELNSVLNVLKTTKMSETKVKSIEKSLNAMKDLFVSRVNKIEDLMKSIAKIDMALNEVKDSLKSEEKTITTQGMSEDMEEIEDMSEESVIGGKALKGIV